MLWIMPSPIRGIKLHFFIDENKSAIDQVVHHYSEKKDWRTINV